ncbi:glycerol kinase GlpK [Pelagibacteraceae bacterium]|nr:glycerol kinase GlpK [Candidatus Pelagibacter sp.]MDC1485314.1 glycerol kinase GlpK [Pelagibacteraceae bacterium]
MKAILAIDQGTTSTRAIIFSIDGKKLFSSQLEFKQYFPKDGWVEHDAEEIWKTTLEVVKKVINNCKRKKIKILTIGITNQRETTVMWNKMTGKPICKAIVWQDRRTENLCQKIKKKKLENKIRKKTGLFIDPYFSATKINWIINNIKKAKQLLNKKQLLFGTIDTFLIWKLTNGNVHATDATNASRTMLFNINNNKWDKELLKIFKVSKNILPQVKNSADDYGHTNKSLVGDTISITGVVGDQQAATIGQCCFSRGSVKSTYGTGAFVLMNTGSKKINSKNKLLTTICYRINNKTTYALEGSIFSAGAGVQWLRDKVKLINNAYDTEKIAKSKKNNNGIYIVPAFTGLGAPYWDANARGLISGITRNSDWKDIVRAVIESVAYQSFDLFKAMNNDGLKPRIVKVDGGMVSNNWFSQFLSDILGIKVIRPKIQETTALGAAFIAGYQIGVYSSLQSISKKWKIDRKFTPKIKKSNRSNLLKGWQQAIKRTLD